MVVLCVFRQSALASFSSRGPGVDIPGVARQQPYIDGPGVSVVSSYAGSDTQCANFPPPPPLFALASCASAACSRVVCVAGQVRVCVRHVDVVPARRWLHCRPAGRGPGPYHRAGRGTHHRTSPLCPSCPLQRFSALTVGCGLWLGQLGAHAAGAGRPRHGVRGRAVHRHPQLLLRLGLDPRLPGAVLDGLLLRPQVEQARKSTEIVSDWSLPEQAGEERGKRKLWKYRFCYRTQAPWLALHLMRAKKRLCT